MENTTFSTLASSGISSSSPTLSKTREIAHLEKSGNASVTQRKEKRKLERKTTQLKSRTQLPRKPSKPLSAAEKHQRMVKKIKKMQKERGVVINAPTEPATSTSRADSFYSAIASFYELAYANIPEFLKATKKSKEKSSPRDRPLQTLGAAIDWLIDNDYVVQLSDEAKRRKDGTLEGITFIHLETDQRAPAHYMEFVRLCHNPAQDGTPRRRMLVEIPKDGFSQDLYHESMKKLCGLPASAVADLEKNYGRICIPIDSSASRKILHELWVAAYKHGIALLKKIKLKSGDDKKGAQLQEPVDVDDNQIIEQIVTYMDKHREEIWSKWEKEYKRFLSAALSYRHEFKDAMVIRGQVFSRKICKHAKTDWTNFSSLGSEHLSGIKDKLLSEIPVVFYMLKSGHDVSKPMARLDLKDCLTPRKQK